MIFRKQILMILMIIMVITVIFIIREQMKIEEGFKIRRYITMNVIKKLCPKTANGSSLFLYQICQEDRMEDKIGNATNDFSANLTKSISIGTTQLVTTKKHYNDQQQCAIPKIDPFHRLVQPFISYDWHQRCTLRWVKSRVEKGVLKIDLVNVKQIQLNYIKRIDDETHKLDSTFVYNITSINHTESEEKSIPLTDDFIKVDIFEFGREDAYSEYHMYPLKKPPLKNDPPFQKYDPTKPKFNVLMVMLDSVSHACAQRYLKKTYRFLQENQNTVIMEGHTILGDATTPQISAMFFGGKPEDLEPEGRKGHPDAVTIDQWPSILKDYKKNGYVTLHSEDQAWIGAFNFRLKGFTNSPTFKYLRSWWQRSEDLRVTDNSRADSCPIKYVLEYMRSFYKEYTKELSFSYVATSALSHNMPKKIQMFDDGFLQFFRDLKNSGQLDSTFVFFFGDHGMREGDFRETTQGQLEERLPFMSITVPHRFIQKHPEKYRNLRQNSKVLTTPYDMHVTLKHLLSISSEPEKHVFGRSIFSDIVKENRTCVSAGVPQGWCVCSQFVPVSSDNDIIRNITTSMVDTINGIIENNNAIKSLCEKLTLSKIIRAGVLDRPYDDEKFEYTTYEIVFRVLPSHGIYEGTAEYNKGNKRTQISLNFSRLNRYGKQPDCIAVNFPYLRKFCFCKHK